MAPEKMNKDTLILMHIIHKDNPTLSGGNWPAVSVKMGLTADRVRKRFAAMRKEFLEMDNDAAAEASAPRKRGRPAKGTGGDANGDAKPKRAKTASAKRKADSVEDDDEAPEPQAKKPKKAMAKKEAADVAPAADDDEA